MEKTDPLNTSYSKKEWWIDSTTFLASSALTCAARSITPLDPAAIGLILSAGANTAAIQATSAFAQKYGIDSRLIQICALISALALSTLALPWILSAASLQTLALLSFETAVGLVDRNHEILVNSTSTSGGRKDVKHEFPNSTFQTIEDLGARQRIYQIAAIINEPNYINKRDSLLRVLEEGGLGTLIHPFYGRI